VKIYKVGGAVRDLLLGRTPSDIDYVVVGASQDDMIQMGYTQVRNSFPVFIGADGCEYALARTERKISGTNPHQAFEFSIKDIAIEEDLARRDLTINSMAMSDKGELIDPFSGKGDIESKVLRHTSKAFHEDPLRVLRVARFAARFPDFSVAPETTELMRKVVGSEEFKMIPCEAVYKELTLALKSERPSRFFYVLKEVGGLSHFFPDIEALIDVPQSPEYHPEGCAFTHTMLVLDNAARTKSKFKDEIVFAALVHDLGKGVTPKEILPKHSGHDVAGLPLIREFCKRLRVPTRFEKMALTVCEFHIRFYMLESNGTAKGFVRVLHEMGVYHDPEKMEIFVEACIADNLGKMRDETSEKSSLEKAFEFTRKITGKDITRKVTGEAFGLALREERIKRLKSYMASEEWK
jgi:tRNA nucleotidyltransferase (CCA-adding enzyme)